jgi:hypothetical protein
MWSYLTSYSIIVAIAISALLCDYVTSLDGNVMSREVGILSMWSYLTSYSIIVAIAIT